MTDGFDVTAVIIASVAEILGNCTTFKLDDVSVGVDHLIRYSNYLVTVSIQVRISKRLSVVVGGS